MPATLVAVVPAAFLLGYALTAGARWLAPRIGFVDRPDGSRKRHAHPMPLMGGVAICASFLLSAAFLPALVPGVPILPDDHARGALEPVAGASGERSHPSRHGGQDVARPPIDTDDHDATDSMGLVPGALTPPALANGRAQPVESIGRLSAEGGLAASRPAREVAGTSSRGGLRRWFPLLASAVLFCLLGLYDDRWGLDAPRKLAGQVAASLPFVLWGETIGTVGFLGIQSTLGIWSVPVTIFWLVACSNVINLMDGMDGLAGTISCIVLTTLAAMAMLMGRYETVVLAVLAAACVTGFLAHNWPPAKIFMGDSGSLMLGHLIGAFAIQAGLKQAASFMLVVPVVLISVPVFDTAMAILRRKLSGRKVGQADRRHIHHRLQDQGFSRVQSLLLIAGLCIAMAGFGVLSFLVNSELLALLLCCSLLATLVVARIFGHDEIDLAWQHLRAIGRLLADTSRVLPSRLLAVRLANMAPEDCTDYWQMVCDRLVQYGGKDLDFQLTDSEDRNVLHHLSWTANQPASPTADTWQVTHTVPRDGGIVATLTATGTVDDPQWAAQVNEASQLIFTLCRSWPLDARQVDSDTEASSRNADVIRLDDSCEQQPSSIPSPEEDVDSLQKPLAA